MGDWLPTGTDQVGRYPTWRTVQGTQVLYGRHRLLARALAAGEPVELKDGSHIEIEHVTAPNSDDYAFAWPTGTRGTPRPVTEIRQARHVSSQRPRVRWHKGSPKAHRRKEARKRMT